MSDLLDCIVQIKHIFHPCYGALVSLGTTFPKVVFNKATCNLMISLYRHHTYSGVSVIHKECVSDTHATSIVRPVGSIV